MSKLEKLISELCPDGVPYKRLDECCTLEKGKTPIQKAIPGEYPLVVTTEERKSANNYQFEKPTVCVPLVSSRGHGVACLNAVYYQEGCFALGNILCGVTPIESNGLTAKFLYYYLNLKKDKLIVPLMKGGANVSLTVNSLKTVKVPIPPHEVQEEVIRLIDKFAELITTLQAELQARKKQYEYYCRKLLAIEDAPQMTLKSISNNVFSGKNKKRMDDGDYPVYGSTGIISTTDSAVYHKEQILIARVGANAGYVHLANGDYDVSDNTLIVDLKDTVFLKYIYYQLSSMNLHQYAKGGGQPLVTAGQMKELLIPVPPIDEQLKIVSVLDKFESICSDISEGLPAEINARQKQYEYYRDKLLTFKELGGTA